MPAAAGAKNVLNAHNEAHDFKKPVVTDGVARVAIGCQNPTLTMKALTVRACDHIVGRYRKQELRGLTR